MCERGCMGQPGQTIGCPGNGGADHLCTRQDVFRASMLVEALLMSVKLGAGSGYKSRAVWTGGFENCCLLSPGGLALLGPCGWDGESWTWERGIVCWTGALSWGSDCDWERTLEWWIDLQKLSLTNVHEEWTNHGLWLNCQCCRDLWK